MRAVQLGFKAFDPHELLCHFVAQRGKLYEQDDFHVELVDVTFQPDSKLPEGMFLAACGSALFSALQGSDLSIVFVAADRPMFSLWSAPTVKSLGDLEGGRLASFPSIAPPARLLEMVLKGHGIRPGKSVHLVDVRDDVARLGLLRNGQVKAALLSSATSELLLRDLNLNQLLFLGEELHIPATGLAVRRSFLDKESSLVRSFLGVHVQALKAIQQNDALLDEVLTTCFGIGNQEAQSLVEKIRFCFGGSGQIAPDTARLAMQLAARELSVEPSLDPGSLYDFSIFETPA